MSVVTTYITYAFAVHDSFMLALAWVDWWFSGDEETNQLNLTPVDRIDELSP